MSFRVVVQETVIKLSYVLVIPKLQIHLIRKILKTVAKKVIRKYQKYTLCLGMIKPRERIMMIYLSPIYWRTKFKEKSTGDEIIFLCLLAVIFSS